MKHIKHIAWIATALLSISAVSLSAGITAEAATGTGTYNGLKYSYDTAADKAVITGYTGSASSVTIPSTLSGCKVREIGEDAFLGKHMTSVSLPNTLTKIGEYAFYGSDLTSLTIPASVTAVSSYAFAYCDNLQTLTINGAAELDHCSFWNCTALTGVQLSGSSKTKKSVYAFYQCPALVQVNGYNPYTTQTDGSGHSYPVLNPAVETAIRNHFCRSANVGFIDNFCSDLCEYIVDTETDPWMPEVLKARQLHDWLIRHCEYEDQNGSERTSDMENQVASSVFISYALNIRGAGIGETVCNGYAKAYNMLLTQAGIECYRIGKPGHSWNLVKVGGQYYQVDVTWDDPITYMNGVVVPDNTFGNIYSTNYTHFLKSNAAMEALHGGSYNAPVLDNYGYAEHPLLGTKPSSIASQMAQCTVSLNDANQDGMLDNDFDMDGTALGADYWEDSLAYSMLCGRYFGYDSDLNDRMPEALYIMHQAHHGVWG